MLVDRVSTETRSTFPKRIMTLRRTNHLSLMQLSNCIDIPASTLNSWERGTAFPKDEQALDKLAGFYGVGKEFLCGGNADD